MTGDLRGVNRRKVYSEIVEQILARIRSRDLPGGTRLPPERILATQLGVGRSSLREALRVLEYAGILDVRTGSGTYVSDDGVSLAAALRARAAARGEQSPLDVVAARRALEPACAALAAVQRSRAEIVLLRATMDLAAERDRLGLDSDEADLAFHRAVAAAAHNPVLLHLVEHTVGILRQEIWAELKLRSQSSGGIAQMLEQHRPILRAIEESDAARAEKAMLDHIDAVEAVLLAGADRSSGRPSPHQHIRDTGLTT
jgi:GntR family transcriptional repressor for pyruvate dehydrogenase complex